jgi:hypothetical protein
LVEYASTVWNPYTKTEINKIEAIQRRAARYVVSNQRNILALKASGVSSSTMSGGSRFQSLTVLGENDIFLVSIRKLKPYKEEQLDMSSATRETDLVSATCSRDSNGDL